MTDVPLSDDRRWRRDDGGNAGNRRLVPVAGAVDNEFRLGWPVVLTCFMVAIFSWGFGAFGPAVYLAELKRQYGWSATTIGSATTISFMIGAGLLPWVGAIIERVGARAVLTGGVLLLGTGVVGISRISTPWQLYACNLLMGLGWAGASSTAISTILARYFDRHRGLALSVALTGASTGGFIVAPALVALSQRHGFQTAVPELTLTLLVVVVPLIWVGIRGAGAAGPNGAAQHTTKGELPATASRRDALCDRRFWSVAGPFALAIAAQVGMMVYQVSYLLPLLGVRGTSVALVCTSVAAGGGRLVLSAVIDRLDQRQVAAMTFASQAAALTLMVLLPGSPPALYVGSILFGLGMGNVVALPTLIIQREFAPRAFGMMLGMSTAIGQIAYSISPVLLGVVRDVSGGYRPTLAVCIGLQAAAALLIRRRSDVSGV